MNNDHASLIARLRSYKPHHDCDCWPMNGEAADLIESDARLLADALAGLRPFAEGRFTTDRQDIARALVTRIDAALNPKEESK